MASVPGLWSDGYATGDGAAQNPGMGEYECMLCALKNKFEVERGVSDAGDLAAVRPRIFSEAQLARSLELPGNIDVADICGPWSSLCLIRTFRHLGQVKFTFLRLGEIRLPANVY